MKYVTFVAVALLLAACSTTIGSSSEPGGDCYNSYSTTVEGNYPVTSFRGC